MPEIKAIAICPQEVRSVVATELKDLGATDVRELFRAVGFATTRELFYRAHFALRSASRLLQSIATVPASSATVLTSQLSALPWPKFFSSERTFRIDGVVGERGPEFPSANELGKAVRLGIIAAFTQRGLSVPKVNLEQPDVVVVAFLRGGRCELSFDTTGAPMHRRGYRVGGGHVAPIKENLAAAVLHLAGYTGQEPLLDPMCGTGTIAIEAALVAAGRSPLALRPNSEFALASLNDFDAALWDTVRENVLAAEDRLPPHAIYASDADPRSLAEARGSVAKLGLSGAIQIHQARFEDLRAPEPHGILVANLPYGERLSEGAMVDQETFKQLGDKLKRDFTGWKAALLLPEEAPYQFIGLRPSRRFSLRNGAIPVKLLVFELYQGTRRPRAPARESDV